MQKKKSNAIRSAVSSAAPVRQVGCRIEPLEGRLFMATSTGGTDPLAAFAATGMTAAAAAAGPGVGSTNPGDGAANVRRDIFISADVVGPNGGVDPRTLGQNTVFLTKIDGGQRVPAAINTSGAGDVIVLLPTSPLEPNTRYRFDITDGVKDVTGAAFAPFNMSFTTGVSTGTVDSTIRFQNVPQPAAQGSAYTALAIGPDRRLYAATYQGSIFRHAIAADGTLGAAESIDSLREANNGNRVVIGLTFDPASTAENPILWVSHSAPALVGAPDFSSKITRLSDDASGTDLARVQDKVTNLPRSGRDHMTNQMAFGPDGALYIAQGSNTSTGAPDSFWGPREEHLLNGAILRLNTAAIENATINAHTEDGSPYDPSAAGAPLTIYATGVRNAYDLVWTRDGKLFAPVNGAGAGGSTPAGGGAPALSDIPTVQSDYLFRVEQGGYYGHPNP